MQLKGYYLPDCHIVDTPIDIPTETKDITQELTEIFKTLDPSLIKVYVTPFIGRNSSKSYVYEKCKHRDFTYPNKPKHLLEPFFTQFIEGTVEEPYYIKEIDDRIAKHSDYKKLREVQRAVLDILDEEEYCIYYVFNMLITWPENERLALFVGACKDIPLPYEHNGNVMLGSALCRANFMY